MNDLKEIFVIISIKTDSIFLQLIYVKHSLATVCYNPSYLQEFLLLEISSS